MNEQTLLNNVSPGALQRIVQEAVAKATQPLKEETRALKRQLHKSRKVVTHKEAPAYFNHEVQPRTIAEKCRSGEIKANKKGRLWFIRVEDLYAYQLE